MPRRFVHLNSCRSLGHERSPQPQSLPRPVLATPSHSSSGARDSQKQDLLPDQMLPRPKQAIKLCQPYVPHTQMSCIRTKIGLHLLEPGLQPHGKNYNKPTQTEKTWATRNRNIFPPLTSPSAHRSRESSVTLQSRRFLSDHQPPAALQPRPPSAPAAAQELPLRASAKPPPSACGRASSPALGHSPHFGPAWLFLCQWLCLWLCTKALGTCISF